MNDDQDNNNNGAEGEGPAQMPAIESLEDWLQRYGLPSAVNGDDTTAGEAIGLNRQEAIERVRAEEKYQLHSV